VDNAARMGQVLVDGLIKLQGRYRAIGNVRGLGLMVAAEFTTTDGLPDTAMAKKLVQECLARRLMLLTCGPYDNVIRFIPPLIVNREQIEEALGTLEAALEAVKGEEKK